MKENPNCLFREQWECELRSRIQNESGLLVSRIMISRQEFLTTGLGFASQRTRIPFPLAVKKWMSENPDPVICQREFIIKLAHRVAALEADLAEKGGAK